MKYLKDIKICGKAKNTDTESLSGLQLHELTQLKVLRHHTNFRKKIKIQMIGQKLFIKWGMSKNKEIALAYEMLTNWMLESKEFETFYLFW